MELNIVTLRFDPRRGGFDPGILQAALEDRVVLSARDHLIERDGEVWLTLVLRLAERSGVAEADVASATSGPASPSKPVRRAAKSKASALKEAESLAADDRAVFDRLRSWRADRSRDEGVPPYVICTNRELLEVVRTRPGSLTALQGLHGFGKAKVRRHGNALLELLAMPKGDGPPAVEGSAPRPLVSSATASRGRGSSRPS